MGDQPPRRNLLRYGTVGLEFFLTFGLFLWLGFLVDRSVMEGWLGVPTWPSFTVLGGLIGFGVAMYRITRQGWGILKEASEEPKPPREEDQD